MIAVAVLVYRRWHLRSKKLDKELLNLCLRKPVAVILWLGIRIAVLISTKAPLHSLSVLLFSLQQAPHLLGMLFHRLFYLPADVVHDVLLSYHGP